MFTLFLVCLVARHVPGEAYIFILFLVCLVAHHNADSPEEAALLLPAWSIILLSVVGVGACVGALYYFTYVRRFSPNLRQRVASHVELTFSSSSSNTNASGTRSTHLNREHHMNITNSSNSSSVFTKHPRKSSDLSRSRRVANLCAKLCTTLASICCCLWICNNDTVSRCCDRLCCRSAAGGDHSRRSRQGSSPASPSWRGCCCSSEGSSVNSMAVGSSAANSGNHRRRSSLLSLPFRRKSISCSSVVR